MLGGVAARGLGNGASLGMANHAFGFGMNVVSEKASGRSMGDALVRGAFWYGAETIFKGAQLIPTLTMAGQAGYEAYRDHKLYGQGKIQKYYQGNFGGNFNDTQQGYTMRQRAVNAMAQSRTNARSVLGSEARSLHR